MIPPRETSPAAPPEGASPIGQTLLAFLFLLPFLILFPSADKTEGPQWFAAALFAAILTMVWLYRGSERPSWTPVSLLLLVTLGAHLLLGTLHGGAPGVQMELLRQLTLALFFLFGATYLATPGGQARLLWTTVLCGSAIAVIGIAQHLAGDPLGLPATSANASVFINKNYAGGFMNLATPAALMLLLGSTDRRSRILAAGSFALCLSYSLITLSRGHWLSLAASLSLLLLLLRFNTTLRRRLEGNRTSQRLATATMLLAPLVFLLPMLGGQSALTPDNMSYKLGSQVSIAARLGYYRNTAALVADHPLDGIGPGAFYTGFRNYYAEPATLTTANEMVGIAHAHDDYLEYFAELGIGGGILMLLLLGLFWYSAWRLATSRSPDRAVTGAAFLLGISAILAHALVDFPLSLPVSSLYLWTWAGALSSVWSKAPAASSESTQPWSPRLRPLFAILGMIYLGITALQGYHSIRANTLILQAARSTLENRCDEALPLAQEALSLAPREYLVWSYHLSVVNICDRSLKQQYLAATRILEQDPNHPYALLTSANALYRAGDLNRAEAHYRELIGILPHRITGYLGVANILQLRGREKEAADYYQRAEALQRRIGSGWYQGPAARTLASLTVQASGDPGWAYDAPMRPLILKLKIVDAPPTDVQQDHAKRKRDRHRTGIDRRRFDHLSFNDRDGDRP